MYKLRPYQQEASDKAVSFLMGSETGHGLIVAGTGSGKSLIIADIASRLDGDVLVLQPSKEILEQNFAKFQSYGFLFCGIYSASCGSKDISKVTFATIGSIINKIEHFKHIKYCIIDECDVVNPKGGMYETFLTEVGCKTIGLTATPYRLHSNSYGSMLRFITRTRPRYFTRLLYYTQQADLVKLGYLSKMEYYVLDSLDTNKLRANSTGADYDTDSIKKEFLRSDFYGKLCNVVHRLLYNAKVKRKGILVFTRFIEEAERLTKTFPGECAIVTGSTPKREREQILSDFKDGKIRVVANVDCLSVGFDYPELDTIVLARPTMSLRLYYQQVGRAIRPHKDKECAWVVDLVGNARKFGRVETLTIGNSGGDKYYVYNNIQGKQKQLTNTILT